MFAKKTTKFISYLLLVLTFSGWARGQATSPTSAAEQLLTLERPLVIAHRGYSALAPENTLPAFEMGNSAGADLVELDYHHTRDGIPVVLHDFTLDRTTDATNRWGGKGLKVSDHTLAQLRELEAGLWFKPPRPSVRLPTLAEALDLIQRRGVTLIERKAGDAATGVKLLEEKGLHNSVVVQAFDWEYLRDFHRLEPRQVLGALGPPSSRDGRKLSAGEQALGVRWLDEIKTVGARVVVWNKLVDAAALKAARERNLKVWIYTINDERVARDLLVLGVDGIITDNPSIIWKALALSRR